MNQVAVKEREAAVPSAAPAIEGDGLLAIIASAARDPLVDVTKMRELLAMRKEIVAEQAAYDFDDAMNKAQEEMRPIAADASNPQTKSKYASYAALDRALRPIYSRHGFSIMFDTADGAPPDCVRVVCDISRKGHTRRKQIDMPADGKGAKGGDVMTKTHATGSALTYGRRYLLQGIFNIAIGDDDGNAAASTGSTVSQEQAIQLQKLIDDFGLEKPFKKFFKIASVEELPASMFKRAVDELNAIGASQRGVPK